MSTTAISAPPAKRLRLDFLYLDLETCTRCGGTHENLESAIDAARALLSAKGTEVELHKIHVTTAEQARELGFLSSPTIRVNGRDLAFELRESSCGSEACTDGCGDSIACRVWVHEGREHTVPPVEMILDAIVGEVYAGVAVQSAPAAEAYELPENLERFFAAKPAAGTEQSRADAGCCSAEEQSSCCEPGEKAECCANTTGGTCGCR